MKSEKELRKLSELYDIENDSPFREEIGDSKKSRQVGGVFEAIQGLMTSNEPKAHARNANARSATQPGEGVDSVNVANLDNNPPATNRGLVKYQCDEFPDGWGGYDGGVEASIKGEWEPARFVDFCQRLDAKKEASENNDVEGSFLEFGGFVWKVRAQGARNGFFVYKWVLESHGVKLYIHSNPKGAIPPVRVRFGFECLARTYLFEAFDTLKDCLKCVGFTWESESLSRVDMQVLVPVALREFVDAMKNRVVTRCRGKVDIHCNLTTLDVETVCFKSGSMELCIYDKRAQVLQADALYFTTFHNYVIRGAEMPEYLTRVEFRFRRDALRRYGITSLDDLKKSQRALVQVAGSDWFRILERDKVRGSEREIKSCPLWLYVMRAFAYYFDSNREVKKDWYTGGDGSEPKDERTARDHRS